MSWRPDLGWQARRLLSDKLEGEIMTRRLWVPLILVWLIAEPVCGAGPAPDEVLVANGPWGSRIRLELVDRLRGEFVDWFEPSPGPTAQEHRYNFLQNKFQLGVRISGDPYEAFFQFQDSTLANVPPNALGVGGAYRANTNRSLQNGAFLRQGWIRTARLFGVDGVFVKAGRQPFSDGMTVVATDPTLRWLQQWRISQRLIGPFDYTAVGRSFDGGQLGWDGQWLNVTGFGFKPTYGGFEVDANRELDVNVAGLAVTMKDRTESISWLFENTIATVFCYYYDDNRDVLYLDNRPLAARAATQGKSAKIYTLGIHAARAQPIGPGLLDVMAYGYAQGGDWQGQAQSAWAAGGEAGYRLADVWAKPWLRLGVNSASGDHDPTDDEHGTFFQMLPTAWLYAQFPFYNMMNNQDVFAQWILDPHPMVTLRTDVHWLRVNASEDFAYFGGGATKDDFFGYGGVPALGRKNLAYLVSFLLTVRPTSFLSVNALYGHAFGQGVIGANFAGTGGNYGYIETVFAF